VESVASEILVDTSVVVVVLVRILLAYKVYRNHRAVPLFCLKNKDSEKQEEEEENSDVLLPTIAFLHIADAEIGGSGPAVVVAVVHGGDGDNPMAEELCEDSYRGAAVNVENGGDDDVNDDVMAAAAVVAVGT